PPDYSMKKGELEVTNHIRNFIDCVRSGQPPAAASTAPSKKPWPS
ncbi:MAG: hypothetical protein HY238_06035, partial [Acidobacteria bacterium]|nr:hypothetical protein [Acidobacteriota bacterium]